MLAFSVCTHACDVQMTVSTKPPRPPPITPAPPLCKPWAGPFAAGEWSACAAQTPVVYPQNH